MTTLDHKRIGLMYFATVSTLFLIGGFFALGIRLHLAKFGAEPLLDPDTYNKFMTFHGAIMVFMVIIPGIPAFLGNFVLPIQLGAKDVAFPRLNLASYYIFIAGAAIAASSMVFNQVDTGWTFYTPYSTAKTSNGVILLVLGAFTMGFSSILTGLNFIVTTHKLRAPGMTMDRIPLMIWALYSTSIIQILATPILAITLLLIGAEKTLGVGIFDPDLGGDPVLFQHFFWFYSHPAVYIMILPAMGVISELITAFSKNNFWLPCDCLLIGCDCCSLLPSLGTPYVCVWPIHTCWDCFLHHHYVCWGSHCHQTLQLDFHNVSRNSHIRSAHALRSWFYVPLYHRWFDRGIPCFHWYGRSLP